MIRIVKISSKIRTLKRNLRMSHIVIILMTSIFNLDAHFKAENMLFELFENNKQFRRHKSSLLTREDDYMMVNALEPLMWRQLSKFSLSVDAIYGLENTSASFFWTPGVLSISLSFDSVSQAHRTLESLFST